MNRSTKLSVAGIGLLCLGLGVYWYNQNTDEPQPEVVDETPEELSSEAMQAALVEQVRTEPELVEQIPEPTVALVIDGEEEAQAPEILHVREAAPDLDAAQLSPGLKRTYTNYSALRTEEYRDPDSELNREVVSTLEAARQQRNSN